MNKLCNKFIKNNEFNSLKTFWKFLCFIFKLETNITEQH